MNPGFEMTCRHSAGNLHINIDGEFNGMCAWELFKILKRHDRSGRVFVNTEKLFGIADEGIELFKSYMPAQEVPKDWLYFKGKKGFKIAPNGSRVLISKKAARKLEDRADGLKQPFRIIRNATQAT